jgi:hypothetical protein
MNTKYKERMGGNEKDDYFQKKFNQEIKNDVFEEKEEPKLIISSNLLIENIDENNKNEILN